MKTNTILRIVAMCAICAVTMVSGCIDSEHETTPEVEYVPVYHVSGVTYGGSGGISYDTPAGPSEHVPSIQLETVVPKPISSIPSDYYAIEADQYFTDHKLYNYLDGYTWNRPLIRGAGWGLPEAAELEHELTEMGCNVSIRVARVKTTVNHDEFDKRAKTDAYARSGCLPELDQTWSWLMIEYDGEVVAYDVYGSYWVFKPESAMKDEYVSGGKWHDWRYYKENVTYIYDGSTWTLYDFMDFDDIYAIEDYYLSGDAQSDSVAHCVNGQWCSYFTSENYNAIDDFMIGFGWWMTDDEYHETETRINMATDWFVLVE